MTLIQKPVLNFQKGRGIWAPDCIVIHIAEGLRDGVLEQFLTHQVSTHYIVNKDGTVWQFVNENDTAWGNGGINNPKSSLVISRKNINPNLYTISIEHEGFTKDGNISETMYQASAELVKEIANRWNIPIDAIHIIGHRDITDQKTCPGPISLEKIITLASAGQPLPTSKDNVKVLLTEIESRINTIKQLL